MAVTKIHFGNLSSDVFATPAIVLGLAASAGAAGTAIRSDSTILAFDATVPTTQASGDAAATGAAAVAARRDHLHGMPAFVSGTRVRNEIPAGDLDGVDTTYVLAHTPIAGTLTVFKNGMLQNPGGGLDYTFATATITFLTGNVPQTGDIVLACYEY